MKKYRHIRLLIVSLGLLLPFPTHTLAAGGVSSLFKLTSSASSATVGGKITMYVFAYQYACAEGNSIAINTKSFTCSDGSKSFERAKANEEFWVTVTGSNNTFTGLTQSGGNYIVKTGADGKGQFTVSSTKAETKTVTISNAYGYNSELNKSLNITFKIATPAAPVVVAPDPPKVTLEVQGVVPKEGAITLRNKQPLVLKGATVANATVKLYIFSDPKQETVTADANGNWTYTVSDLEPGDHHIEADVTDPKTGKTSARTTLATFAVAQPAKAAAAQKADEPSLVDLWIWLAVGAVAVLATGIGAWWWLVKRKIPASPTTPSLSGQNSDSA